MTDPALDLLRRSPFAFLPEPTLEALASVAAPRALALGDVLATENEKQRDLVLLASGRARATRRTLEGAAVVADLGPGEIAGDLGDRATTTIVVASRGDGLALPTAATLKLALADVDVRLAVARGIHAATRRLEDRLRASLVLDTEGRIAHFLLDVAERWGRHMEDGTLIECDLTHAEIAAAVGSTRETVTVLLGRLRRSGAVEMVKRRIKIRERSELVALQR